MKLLTENSDWHIYYDYLSDYDEREVLSALKNKRNLWTPLIPPSMYQQALNEFTRFGRLDRFPVKYIYQWMGYIMKNTAIIRAITSLAGHDVGFPYDAVVDVFFNDDDEKWEEYKSTLSHKGNFSPDFGWMENDEDEEEKEVDDDEAASQFLEDNGYYDMMTLPDGSDAWSDYGIRPLEEIIEQYDESLEPEKVLVLINKALDVTHQRGDLASAFIEGGKSTLSSISNKGYVNESKNSKSGNMKKEELKEYIEHLKPMFNLIKSKFNIDVPYPTVVFELKKQNCEPILIKTGYFDPNTNKIHIFLCDNKGFRSVKDVMRSFCHECIHYFQQYNGTIQKSGYKGDQITEDNNLIRLELEAYAKGNLYFREYTENLNKKNGKR